MMFAKMLSREDFDEDSAIRVACAIELAHSSLLIHDDIIDRDNTRRGNPSMHYQYETYAQDNDLPRQKQFGISMAICVGDTGFFMANELLSELNTGYSNKLRLIKCFNNELCSVGLAEMQDVFFEYLNEEVSVDDILSMYNFKTARYTFSLPMMMGAIIAGCDEKIIQKLCVIGENMGQIFQIKDDELGIFGDEKTLGKSVGIDIMDNKKTLYQNLLMTSCNKKESTTLKKIFGNRNITDKEINAVRKMIVDNGICTKISQKVKSLEENCKKLISEIDINEDSKKILLSLLKYNLERKK